MTDWNNIDLKDGHERSLNILEPYSFDTLLLEVNCNLPTINENTVRAQFEKCLWAKLDEAREIFNANVGNIVKQAIEERKQ